MLTVPVVQVYASAQQLSQASLHMLAVAEHTQCALPATSRIITAIVVIVMVHNHDENDNSTHACQPLLGLCSIIKVSPPSPTLAFSIPLVFP